MASEHTIGGTRLVLLQGDITEQAVDVIVNAANPSLLGGGGVDGAIHRRGGPAILEECRAIVARIGRCEPGEAVRTTAGRLQAKHVVHTVGPIYRDGRDGEADVLTRAWTRSLELAQEVGARSVAFPAISTGVYGYPVAEAARVSLLAAASFLRTHEHTLDEIRIVLFSAAGLAEWETAAADVLAR